MSLTLLDRGLLAEVDRQLGVGDDGQALAPSTAARYRKVAKACIRRAVELEILPSDPWPPVSRGRAQRKAVRVKRSMDTRILPDPQTMVLAIDAIRSHQPGSATYQVMTAVAYYAGLRPSEVVMLRGRALHLPDSGWGRIDVVEADVSFDEPGEPKTGRRSVPIPPQLVEILRGWVEEREIGLDALLFRTRNGSRPTASNWSRAYQRALRRIGHHPLRVYDCRHAAATTWLKAACHSVKSLADLATASRRWCRRISARSPVTRSSPTSGSRKRSFLLHRPLSAGDPMIWHLAGGQSAYGRRLACQLASSSC
jgi:integrase